jgi:hypothetical protein
MTIVVVLADKVAVGRCIEHIERFVGPAFSTTVAFLVEFYNERWLRWPDAFVARMTKPG